MKTKWFSILSVLASIFALAVGSCASSPASAPASGGSSIPDTMPGTWRFSDLNGGAIIEIGADGAGTLKMFDSEGNVGRSGPVAADGTGRIQFGTRNAQYRLADAVVGKIYLGERMIITGFTDNPLPFYKTNPSKTISLGGTSWVDPRLPATYIFNDDGSFRIDIGFLLQAFNNEFLNADTEGTYTINGIEVTLNYPNGKALKWTQDSDGDVSINSDVDQTDSHKIFIEGNSFILGYGIFMLSE